MDRLHIRKEIQEVLIMTSRKYNNSGNMVKNEKYHSVLRKTTQALNGTAYIHFAFVP